jgi:hypothetical protein
MIKGDIDSVYNNMLVLLKEEIIISQNTKDKDKGRLSYRLRNIFTFILEHYDALMISHKELIKTHMTKYYTYAIDTINTEYNTLSNTQLLSVVEQKLFDDYKKTINCIKRFTDKYYV